MAAKVARVEKAETVSTLADVIERFSKKTTSYRPPVKTPLPSASFKPSDLLADRFDSDYSRIVKATDRIPTIDELKTVASRIKLKFGDFTGARPASGSVNGVALSKVGNYERSWYRDMALLADSMFEIGLDHEGTDILFRIFKFANSPEQRERFFDNFVAAGRETSWGRYQTQNTAIFHPHIVGIRNDSGDLQTSHLDWGHAQIDGIALSLRVLFYWANKERINILDFNEKLNAVDYSNYPANKAGSKENFNKFESIMVLMLKFLSYINAPHQNDFAAWEEYRHPKRLSIATATAAAAIEAKEHFVRANWNPKDTLTVAEDYTSPAFYQDLNRLIDAGTWVMENRIPTDGNNPARESDHQIGDGSCCWILGTLYKTLPISMNQQQGLINAVNTLIREWGIARYENDRFLGPAYLRNGNDCLMSHNRIPGREATWPLLSAYYAKYCFDRFAKGGYINTEMLARGISHANSVFSQVTVPTKITHHKYGEADVEGGFLPEANSFDPDDPVSVRPTAHASPLIWTEAATMSMMASYLGALGFEIKK